MNQLVRSKRYDDDQFEQVEAICDVLIAAENRLPNGLKDYYGMIRVNRFGPVLLEDFEKLMKLLDKTHNHFPFSQEAADKASLAWSLLSKPPIKAHYDLAIFAFCGECSKGKRKMGFHESFIPKKQIEVVVISDDDDDDYDDRVRP
ncbi:unnamed protein product [Arabidopsis lyrata]|nr:unnamed protein product [Arabidopsis lyrata]